MRYFGLKLALTSDSHVDFLFPSAADRWFLIFTALDRKTAIKNAVQIFRRDGPQGIVTPSFAP